MLSLDNSLTDVSVNSYLKHVQGVGFISGVMPERKPPRCKLCKGDLRAHYVQPVMYGGKNAIDYWSCEDCGVMFKKVIE